MKKLVSGILAVSAAMAFTATSYATEDIDWTYMSQATTMAKNSTLSSTTWNTNYTGTLASNGAWARLQEFDTKDMAGFDSSTVTMYDLDENAVVTPSQMHLRVKVGHGGSNSWYGGGTKVKLSDRELMPGGQYEITVKAGVLDRSGKMFYDGLQLYASFLSAADNSDMRQLSAPLLAKYDANAENNAAAKICDLPVDQVTVDDTAYYKIGTYTTTLTADESLFTYGGAYCGFTTLNLFVANRTQDADGVWTWNPVIASNTAAELVLQSVSIKQVNVPEEAKAIVKRGARQTFEKTGVLNSDGLNTSDKQGWALDSENSGSAVRITPQKKYTVTMGSNLKMETRQKYSDYDLAIINDDTSEAADGIVYRNYSKYELCPEEAYNLTFYAHTNSKSSVCPVVVSVGDTEITTFENPSSAKGTYFGSAIYGWKQFTCTIPAQDASAYTADNGTIKVAIKFKDIPSGTRVHIDDVTLTAKNQSFKNNYTVDGESQLSFYTNLYSPATEVNATRYIAGYIDDAFTRANISTLSRDANVVSLYADIFTLGYEEGSDDENKVKIMYWDDDMNAVAAANEVMNAAE